MRTQTLKDFQDECRAQGVPSHEHVTVICPACGTPQNARDLILAGVGKTFEEVEPFLGFSCVGRWTGAGGPRKEPDGKPCNWTLGGLLTIHTLEVITEDGERHPRFELASPEVARAHVAHQDEALDAAMGLALLAGMYATEEPKPKPEPDLPLDERWSRILDTLGFGNAEGLVMECFNCEHAEIDDDADVWISRPMKGHWLTDEEMTRLVKFIEARREAEGTA